MADINKIDVLNETLKNKRYKNGYTPPEEDKLLTISDKVVGTVGNFCVYSGLPKAGKSTFLSATIASAITKDSIFDINFLSNIDKANTRFALFDTESSESDFYKSLDRIKSLCYLKNLPSFFDAYRLRDCDHSQNKQLIEHYVSTYAPQAIVIDGLLDLLMNFNDEIESRNLINWLKRLTDVYKCFVLGVIHTGKGNGLTLGHLGSMLERYAQSVLLISKDEERHTIDLTARYMRSDAHFNDISITRVYQPNGSHQLTRISKPITEDTKTLDEKLKKKKAR